MKLVIAATMLALPALALQNQPASDLSVHSEKVPGITVRFVDWHWRPELFAEMEKGGGTTPEAKRNWALLRLINEDKLTFEGTPLPASNYALALWPNLDGKGMMFELRRVDMREVLQPNAWAPIPAGTTMWKGPAKFETVPETADRLVVSLSEAGGKGSITIRYGNRRAVLSFAR